MRGALHGQSPVWRYLLAAGVIAVMVGIGTVAAITSGAADDSRTPLDPIAESLQQEIARTTDSGERANLEEKLAQVVADRDAILAGREAEASAGFAQEADRKRETLLEEAVARDREALPHAEWIPAGAGFIVEDATPFEHPRMFVAENDWFVDLGDPGRLVVWAGREGADPAQGVLRVWREGPGGGLQAVVPIPGKHGAARIVGADGWVLDVVSADGSRYRFDARTWELVALD